jgi:two-component system, cell cycle sensor histidine kinase and response regulator CckA
MTATQRAADLASRMLVYLGQTRERPQSLDLSETCREFLAMFRSRLPAGIVPKADLPAAGPRIRGKPEHLRQLLENLIGNAAEAMENRTGEIRIRLTIRPGWRIARQRMFPAGFRPDPARRYAKLEISDAGAGIPAANLDRLFDPFFSTRFVGRGLGLAMVQGIVKAMGGGIAVDSKEGLGSRFRVYLPAEEDESSGNENENPTPEDAPPG